MSTNVVPRWVKYLLLIACVAIGWWCFAGEGQSGKTACLGRGASPRGNNFLTKAAANISQLIHNPLKPPSSFDAWPVILRVEDKNYYRDQPCRQLKHQP